MAGKEAKKNRSAAGSSAVTLPGFTAEEVVEAVERNLIESSAQLGRSEEGVVFRGSDVTWVYTGFQAMNRVLRSRFTPDNAGDRIDQITNFFGEWNAPLHWVLGPSCAPPSLADKLVDRNFVNGSRLSGMAVDLAKLPPEAPLPPGVEIRAVDTDEELLVWSGLKTGIADTMTTAVQSVFTRMGFDARERWCYFLAYLDGQPVARSMWFSAADVAGVYWLATEPQARNKGIGAALLAHTLRDAHAAGHTAAVAHVPEAAVALYRRAGFMPCCNFTVLAWMPAAVRVPA